LPSRRRPDAVAASGRRAFPASSRVWSHCRSSCPVRGTAARPCALRRGRPRPPRSRPPPPRSRRTTPSSCAGRRAAAASPVPGSVSRWTTRDRPPWVRWSSTPRTAAERADVDRAVTRVVAGCRARSARLLPHVGTLDVARDLDIPRAALGDTTLTYLSASPTALYVGAKYAEMLPRRLQAAVLDGAGDLALDAARRPGSQRRCAAFCSPAVPRGPVEPRPPTRTPGSPRCFAGSRLRRYRPRTRRPAHLRGGAVWVCRGSQRQSGQLDAVGVRPGGGGGRGRVRPPTAVRRHRRPKRARQLHQRARGQRCGELPRPPGRRRTRPLQRGRPAPRPCW
jgi:hypothetical protein